MPLIRRELWTLAVMGLICGLLGLVVPIVTAIAIDDAIPRADRRQLDLLCAFLVAVALAVASFQAIQTVALARLRGKLESSLLPAFWDRLLDLPVRFFAQYEAGDLAIRALGPVRLIEVLASTTVASMLVSVFALFNVAALFVLNWRLGLVAAGLMAVFPLATAAALRPIWRLPARDLGTQGRDRRPALRDAGRDFAVCAWPARSRGPSRAGRRAINSNSVTACSFQTIAGRLVLFGDVWPIAVLMVVLAVAVFGSAFHERRRIPRL